MSWSPFSVSDTQIATELLRRKGATESLTEFTEYKFELTGGLLSSSRALGAIPECPLKPLCYRP
jgi:hypothetical protein